VIITSDVFAVTETVLEQHSVGCCEKPTFAHQAQLHRPKCEFYDVLFPQLHFALSSDVSCWRLRFPTFASTYLESIEAPESLDVFTLSPPHHISRLDCEAHLVHLHCPAVATMSRYLLRGGALA
jgi:hypothetical protein